MMDISIKRIAVKDIEKLPGDVKDSITDLLFNELPNYSGINQIPKFEKLKGFKIYYRIRSGDYRIGLKYEFSKITIIRVLHRKEIYKYFP